MGHQNTIVVRQETYGAPPLHLLYKFKDVDPDYSDRKKGYPCVFSGIFIN